MDLFYTLEGKTPVPCPGLQTYVAWFFSADRRVSETYLADCKIRVSTVFVGHAIDWDTTGHPLLFETIIFIEGENRWQCKTATWEDAEACHRGAIEVAKGLYVQGEDHGHERTAS